MRRRSGFPKYILHSALLVVLVALAACSSTSTATTSTTPPTNTSPTTSASSPTASPTPLGNVEVLGIWGGEELASFQAMVAPWAPVI